MGAEYNDSTYDVTRVESDSSPYKYDFILTVDGSEVMTATRLERQHGIGFEDLSTNWTTALETFAEAYIDTGSTGEAVERVKQEFV